MTTEELKSIATGDIDNFVAVCLPKTTPTFLDERPRDEFDPAGPGPGKTKEQVRSQFLAERSVKNLKTIADIIEHYPALADCISNIDAKNGEMQIYSWGEAWKKLIASTDGFGWVEQLSPDKCDAGIVDAVATRNGITFRIRHIRTLARSKFEDFIPRDLKPENKEFVEETK